MKSLKTEAKVTSERRAKFGERRLNGSRRTKDVPVAVERRHLERREKVNRRRQIDPTTCERDYTTEEVEFMHAMDDYKRSSGRMFPTCSEILEVIRALGYQKPAVNASINGDAIDGHENGKPLTAIILGEQVPM